MSIAVLLALAAMLGFGLVDLVYKRAARAGVAAHHFLLAQAWCFTPAIVIYGLATGTLALGAPLLWGAAAGLFVYLGLYNFSRSLRHGSVTINAPIFRLNFMLTAALAVLVLDEPFTAGLLAGLGLALAAVWLLLGAESVEASMRAVTRTSLAQVLVATVAAGVANFVYKVGMLAGATPASFLVGQASVFISIATVMAYRMDRGLRPARAAWHHGALSALVLLFTLIFLLEALGRGEASVLVPIAQMGFVATAVFGFVFLREPLTLRKAAGLASALAALALLSAG